MTPARGSVAWWQGGNHVAWVSSVNANGTVTVEEYNNPAGSGAYNVRTISKGSVSGYIHFKDLPSGMPFGNFEAIQRAPGGAKIRGWAIDPNAANGGKGAIRVDTYGGTGSPGNGNPGRALTANLHRGDVGRVHPKYGPNHGYDGSIALGHRTHKVCAYAINVGPGSHKQIGCKSINISPHPFGSLDTVKSVPGGVEVSGWSIDPDTASPIRVHLYGGSGASVGSNPAISLTADKSRPDVKNHYEPYGDLHGYRTEFFDLPAGEHKVCAYAINAANTPGSNKQIGCKEVYVSPHPFGDLHTPQPVDGGVMVRGWAIDPDTASSIGVHVYGGSGSASGSNPAKALIADKSRPDVEDVYPSYGDLHGYEDFFPLPSGQQTVCAYGINAPNTPGSNKQIGGCKTVTVP